MAAYGNLVSLLHLIEQIQHHPRPPISLDKDQVQSLTENVTFLQEFLEVYSHVCNKEVDRLQNRIRDVAHAAENVIEIHIVDKILAQSTNHVEQMSGSTVDLYQGLQKVIQHMDRIKKHVTEIQEKMGSIQDIEVHGTGSVHAFSSSRFPPKGKNIMVGFDAILTQLMDKLTGHQSDCQIIPIVGMGGIGKTTLAKNAYENPLIVDHFDIHAWVTISQEHSIKKILLEALSCKKYQENNENFNGMSEAELGNILHKRLFDRRYLMIIDDMWSYDTWEKVKSYFPENNNGSRVIITTRQSYVSSHLSAASSLEMNFLDEELSWNLLCKIVFGEDECPRELEKIGKRIAQNCKGLPLSIVVIGGLLVKSKKTREYWKEIAENLNSKLNLEDNERCFKLLYMSYNYLPIHLKPCFLYMGLYPENSKIRVSYLIKEWVAEGFLKPIIDKSSEEVAERYLKELVDRNLILTHKQKSSGKMKYCKIHDLLRVVCLREAQREKFLCVSKLDSFNNSPQGIIDSRRIAIHGSTGKGLPQGHYTLQVKPLVRSLIWRSRFFPSPMSRLLRVLITSSAGSRKDDLVQQVNLRYLFTNYVEFYEGGGIFRKLSNAICRKLSNAIVRKSSNAILRKSSNAILRKLSNASRTEARLWNLQTLLVRNFSSHLDIWRIPLLRHVKLKRLFLLYDSGDRKDDFVLENLQTLSNVVNFRCSEEMVKMIPNIKKLQISYDCKEDELSCYCLNNLVFLHKLESLKIDFDQIARPSHWRQNISFPHSLKKLTLQRIHFRWQDISIKMSSLPLLQVLQLRRWYSIEPKLETVEGHFPNLKILRIDCFYNLERWTTDSTHFPRLEQLVLKDSHGFKEIPSCIGEIPTLQLIELEDCGDSVIFSAKKIMQEQEELGNDSLKVRVMCWDPHGLPLERLASGNFEVVNTFAKKLRKICQRIHSAILSDLWEMSLMEFGKVLMEFGIRLATMVFLIFIAFTTVVSAMVLKCKKFGICFTFGCALIVGSLYSATVGIPWGIYLLGFGKALMGFVLRLATDVFLIFIVFAIFLSLMVLKSRGFPIRFTFGCAFIVGSLYSATVGVPWGISLVGFGKALLEFAFRVATGVFLIFIGYTIFVLPFALILLSWRSASP